MVAKISSFGRNGIHDFILIRLSAVILALYSIYLLGFFFGAEHLNYYVWSDFWEVPSNKIFTMLALISVLIHAWIGLWQVLTDYIKAVWLRAILQFSVVLILAVYVLTGLFVLWGV